MPAPPQRIEIDGLDEVRKGLALIDRGAPRVIGKAGRKAARVVAGEAKRNAPVFAGEQRTPWRIVDSIKVTGTSRGAGIKFGGPKAPHAPVHEFGGTIRRAGSGLVTAKVFERGTFVGTRTFAPDARSRFRSAGQQGGFGAQQSRANAGRTRIVAQPYLYPAIASKSGEVKAIFLEELDTLLREFPQL